MEMDVLPVYISPTIQSLIMLLSLGMGMVGMMKLVLIPTVPIEPL